MEGRVLIIEDQAGNRELVAEKLAEEGLSVTETKTGAEGLKAAMRWIPQAILVSTSLPDMSGVEVAKRLRSINRISHVFLMLIGDEDDRSERLEGLEAGANDFVTSPIDADLVMLRVRNAIHRANLDNHTDPVTGMPAGRRVQEELMRLVGDPEGDWVLMHIRVRNLEPFREVHGFMAGDELLRSISVILAEALSRDDIDDDFLGYGGNDDFIVITLQERADDLVAEVTSEFDEMVGSHYDFMEREQGYVEFEGEQHPLASLRVRQVTPDDGPFYDIRALSEALAG